MLSRRNIILGLIASVILVLAYATNQLAHTYQANNFGTVKLTVVPKDASLSVDSAKTQATPAQLSLAPGSHTLTFNRSGFENKTITVNVTAGQTIDQSVVLPIANATGTAYRQNNPSQQTQAEKIGGQTATQGAVQTTTDNPLIALLPYTGSNFDINVGVSQKSPNNPDAVGIYISADNAAGRTNALNWIKAQGYDPNAYEIIYQPRTQ